MRGKTEIMFSAYADRNLYAELCKEAIERGVNRSIIIDEMLAERYRAKINATSD